MAIFKGAVLKGVLGGALSAPLFFSAAPSVADVAAGEEDYRMRCAACHGERGLGDGPIAYYFTAPPPPLALLARDNDGVFPRARVADVIDGRSWSEVHGGRAMPIWGEVFEANAREDAAEAEDVEAATEAAVAQRIGDLIEYIEALQVR